MTKVQTILLFTWK